MQKKGCCYTTTLINLIKIIIEIIQSIKPITAVPMLKHTDVKTYIPASIFLFNCSKVIVSYPKVEKVVNAPQKPTPIKSHTPSLDVT